MAYNPLEFSRKTVRRARKKYTCWKCKRAIRIGELHYEYVGKYDGSFFAERECGDH